MTPKTSESLARPEFTGWRKRLADRLFKYGKLAGMCLGTPHEPYRVYLKGVEDALEAVYQDLVLAEESSSKVYRLEVQKAVRYRLLENLTVIYEDARKLPEQSAQQ